MPKKKDKKKTNRKNEIRMARNRVCFYCQEKKEPTYTDSQTLRKFVSDRMKITPRLRSGACSKHQRAVTQQIKYARHLSLIPFTPKA